MEDSWWDIMKGQFATMEIQIKIAWTKYLNDTTENSWNDFFILLGMIIFLIVFMMPYSLIFIIPTAVLIAGLLATSIKINQVRT